MRVLLVDDDLSIRTVLWRELKVAFEVIVSPDAAHASRVMQNESELGAVVTDFDLGFGPNGLAVLTEAATRHPSSFRLLVSGSEGMAALAALHPTIIHAFLPKPWPPLGVREAVVAHMKASKKLAIGSQGVPRASKHPTPPSTGAADALVEVDVKFTDWSLFRLVQATEIDLGGMVLPMSDAPNLGQELTLSVHMPGGGQIELVSRVARVQLTAGPTPYLVSVEFTRLTEEQRKALVHLLARRKREQS